MSPGANENSKSNRLKHGKTRATKSRLVLILNLIGWESGVIFVDQLHNEVKQNKAISDFFRRLI